MYVHLGPAIDACYPHTNHLLAWVGRAHVQRMNDDVRNEEFHHLTTASRIWPRSVQLCRFSIITVRLLWQPSSCFAPHTVACYERLGRHTCQDVYCVTCDTTVGWEYVRAWIKSGVTVGVYSRVDICVHIVRPDTADAC